MLRRHRGNALVGAGALMLEQTKEAIHAPTLILHTRG
jgi:hypothetical protein